MTVIVTTNAERKCVKCNSFAAVAPNATAAPT